VLLSGLGGLLLGLMLLYALAQREVKPPAADLQSRIAGPIALTQPAVWQATLDGHAGLTTLTWPDASTAQDVQHLLNRQLSSGTASGRWKAVLARGDAAAACAGKPVFTLVDQSGERFQLALVESGLPTAAVALGEERPILRGLQQYLHGRGWLVASSVDGVMGPQTMAALGRFQAEERLVGTGQFDPATAYRLSCRLPVPTAPSIGNAAAGA
jgi:hypothetical protein